MGSRRSPPRLLDVKSHRLVPFPRDQAPPYAILSHTWGPEGEEITYQEWLEAETLSAKSTTSSPSDAVRPYRKGYAKIYDACRQAEADSFKYLWSDTCCINKENDAELSEAIRSMYAWYAHAQRCYAYLSDLNINTDGHDRSTPATTTDVVIANAQADLALGLSRCVWFTRGWCLQELLAPKEICFFDSSWRSVEYPDILPQLISAITKIPVAVLTQQIPISDCCLAQRLSWAADRRTSRVEDRAYSLFGILGVNMAPMYGEGSDAFARLQRELLQDTRDPTIFAWTSADPARKTSLLAATPEDFRHSTNIRVKRALGTSCHFSRTNVGIAGDFLIIEPRPHDRNQVFALLNCHLDDAPEMMLVLRLTIHLEESQHGRVTYFVDELDHAPHLSPLFSRLALVKTEHTKLAQLQSIRITACGSQPLISVLNLHELVPKNLDVSGLHVQYFDPLLRDAWQAVASTPEITSEVVGGFEHIALEGPGEHPLPQPWTFESTEASSSQDVFTSSPYPQAALGSEQLQELQISNHLKLSNPPRLYRSMETSSGERLYSSFKVRNRQFYCVGRVFLVLWAEPAGESRSTVQTTNPLQEREVSTGRFGERVFSKVRHFVVIKAGQGFCTAVPIATYRGRGVSMRGTIKRDHAVIYTGESPPAPRAEEQPGYKEQGMQQPVRVVPDNLGDNLDPASRIDFGKVHTIHHNIRTKAFGMVHAKSLALLLEQFQNVWLFESTSRSAAPRRDPVSVSLDAGLCRGAVEELDGGTNDEERVA
ncbi:hypothetical protein LTR86_003543 [Recurvomyces mirabilis]|nr:hypothetical protein LTR86_003543 [Recurvomyces mirabilis]